MIKAQDVQGDAGGWIDRHFRVDTSLHIYSMDHKIIACRRGKACRLSECHRKVMETRAHLIQSWCMRCI